MTLDHSRFTYFSTRLKHIEFTSYHWQSLSNGINRVTTVKGGAKQDIFKLLDPLFLNFSPVFVLRLRGSVICHSVYYIISILIWFLKIFPKFHVFPNQFWNVLRLFLNLIKLEIKWFVSVRTQIRIYRTNWQYCPIIGQNYHVQNNPCILSRSNKWA